MREEEFHYREGYSIRGYVSLYEVIVNIKHLL
jgi:hypothetical protein